MFRELNTLLRRFNVRFAATMPALAAWLSAMLALAGPAMARQATASPPDTLRVPDTAQSLAAFQTIDGWLVTGAVPEQAQAIDPMGTSAACVTLRVSGRVLGSGVSVADDGTAAWQAARLAMSMASHDPMFAGGDSGILVGDALERASVEVEFAGTPIELMGDTFDEAGLSVLPGLEGVMVRAGARRAAFFPARMRATAAAPPRALRAACSEIALPPVEARDLRQDHQARLMRFAVQHIARFEPRGAPEFLHRGGRIVPLASINTQSLREAAQGIAEHLLSHRWQGDGAMGMAGDFALTIGEYDPLVAAPADQALAAAAMARYAARVEMPALRRARFEGFSLGVLNELAMVEADETPITSDPSACAAYVCAWHSLTDAARARADDAARALAADALGVVRASCNDSGAMSPPARAMSAWGLALAARADPADTALREQASSLTRDLFARTDRAMLPGLMPWLGWAELELAGQGSVPSSEAMRDMRELLWAHQVDEARAGAGGADLVGGILLSNAAPALPTFHGLRPLAFAGSMLGDARLTTDAERAEQVSRLTAGLRFAVQLGVDSSIAAACPTPDLALGGIRPALWEPVVSVNASSLALIVLTEALHATK